MDVAQGEYISFVDPDDVVFYDYYKKMIENIGNGDFIFCDFIRFSDSCIFDDKVEFDTIIYEKEEIYFCVYYWSAINPIWNKLIKKSIISNLRFDINLKNAEDTLFNFQLLKRCNKVVYIKTELYGYCMRNDGAVGLMDLKGKKDVVEAYQKIYNFREISENKQLHRFWNTKLCYAYIILFFEFLDKKEKNNADFKNCKKYLIKNLHSILFFNNMLNHKEKILLLIKLFLY